MALNATPSNLTPARVRQTNVTSGTYGLTTPINVLDPHVDYMWGQAYRASPQSANNLFDYYYSGGDIKVVVDGLEDDPTFGSLPIAELAFSVQQQKQPVYGFASFTYDAVMRGQRIVQGAFSITTTTTDYMTRTLQAAAAARAARQGPSQALPTALTDDDKNIQTYWQSNTDPSLQYEQFNVFSAHPPFNLIITYGVQQVSLTANYLAAQEGYYSQYQNAEALFTDTNERLVESDQNNWSNRFILSNCDLTTLGVSYDSSGSVLVENYSFMAQDLLVPLPGGFGSIQIISI